MRTVIPVVQPAVQKPQHGFGYHFFRFLRAVALTALVLPLGIVGVCQWRIAREAQVEADLKRDMLERGLSVQEIERVLRAPHHSPPDSRQSSYYTTQHAEIEARLIRDLSQSGMSANDIEYLLKNSSVGYRSVPVVSHDTAQHASKQAQFIRDLARDGRSAEEIRRLLHASTRGQSSRTELAVRDAERTQRGQIEEALKTLLRSGMTPEEIESLLKPNAPVREGKAQKAEARTTRPAESRDESKTARPAEAAAEGAAESRAP